MFQLDEVPPKMGVVFLHVIFLKHFLACAFYLFIMFVMLSWNTQWPSWNTLKILDQFDKKYNFPIYWHF